MRRKAGEKPSVFEKTDDSQTDTEQELVLRLSAQWFFCFFMIQSRTFTVKSSEDAIKRPPGVDLWAKQEWNKKVKICSKQRRTICKGVKEKRPPPVPKIKCPAACEAPWFTYFEATDVGGMF